ncbi:organic cation/carnitine transporter 2-like [Phragmites australis]|uniref:organic cation/carnitine transporter 2-like n=1 Tax=Phragmites australis TaxID=29695 RepID=UPI002D769A6E|nr:organic cation/carnitine transporter 2-like [Phragmites australis]
MADTAIAPLLTSHKAKLRLAKEPSIDDTIETYIGATGAMQLFKAILLAFAWAFDAQQVFISVFTDAEPQWHCTTGSPAASCSPAAASPCALPPGAWAWDRPAETSVVSEWALKCAGPALVSLPASSFFAGCLAGGFLLTTLADSLLGRKTMLLVSLVSMSVAGVLTALAPNVWAYAALRFLCGFGRSMVGTCTLVLSTELVGKRWRDTVSVAGFFFFTIGFLSLPALAYTFRDASWRNMYFWTSVPSLCYSILLYFLVQESPRWLLVRGRKQDAIETLQQIASLNGNSITSSFSMLHACTMHEDDGASGAGGVFATLQTMWERPWVLRRLAAIMAASFGVGTVYYGMPLNVGSLGSNLYLSVTYNALAELPSSILAWLFLGRVNRRSSVVALTVAAGAFSLACVAIPPGSAARMAAEIVSFFATCTAFNIILIYSIELFPTSVRNSAVGLVRQALVLGGVAAPVLVALGRERSFWSFGVFGLAIGCFGLFAACLPETRGRTMSDTMEEEEHKEAAVASCTGTAAIGTNCNSDLV